MPKIVNHEEKKERIAEATWRVILREGMRGATVRGIAKEAGMSLGALRHYFSTQDELITYAMQLVRERALSRISIILQNDLPPKGKVLAILNELVPANDDTRAEMDVWLAYTLSGGRERSRLQVDQELYDGVRRLIAFLDQAGTLRRGLDKDLAAETLYAIVDGLAVHAYLEPGRLQRERISAVFSHYLDTICAD